MLSVCRKKGEEVILELLRAAKEAVLLHRCVSTDDLKGLGPLLSQPDLLNWPDEQGRTPLLHAVDSGSLGCVKALVRLPHVDMETADKQCRRPEEVAR